MASSTTATEAEPFIYAGTPIHARGFALAALYNGLWRPPAGGAWVEHSHLPNCWQHPSYPRHVVWKRRNHDVVVTQLAASTPDVSLVLHLGRTALGPGASPQSLVSYPLALRLPMRGPGKLTLPQDSCRCRRLWPPPGEDPCLDRVEGKQVELRVSGTSAGQELRLYGEVFVGRAHENRDGEPRSLIFTGDARHVLLAPARARWSASRRA